MQLKEYQLQTLETFERWLKQTEEARRESENAISDLKNASDEIINPILNYPKHAWEKMVKSGEIPTRNCEYVERTAAAGFAIPHVCFKVPTGGGKTLLGAAALESLNKTNGLVLWMVPSNAIYRQTKATLWNREHPYRKFLERASGGRVKMLEKNDYFTTADIEHYLCVMLVSLQSANRMNNKEFLKIFQDTGRYTSFFPDSDDSLSERRLRSQHKDLDPENTKKPIKHSLFNVLKMNRPIIILDEAHKAYGKKSDDEFVSSINRLNPNLVLELSATPNRNKSNLLVDISGTSIKAEEMIKLPIKVTSFSNTDWQHTLIQSHQQLEKLHEEATKLQHNSGRYIRPIAVVRVERTGVKQQDSGYIHANDVRTYLVQNLGVSDTTIAIQSAETKELTNVDLMSEFSSIQWIITRDALKEGWDCPFAYLLVILDNTTAKTAVTQLIGRVMRQPSARLTGIRNLDSCYVYCHNISVGDAVYHVKDALEQEGMTDLEHDIEIYREAAPLQPISISRRQAFKDIEIVLPKVLHSDQTKRWVDIEYVRHILPEINWSNVSPPEEIQTSAHAPQLRSANVDVMDATVAHEYESSKSVNVDTGVKLSWYARRLSDIVPNPFQAAQIVQSLLANLRNQGNTNDDIFSMRSSVVSQLRSHIFEQVDAEAERIFRSKLSDGHVRFDLTTKEHNHFMTTTPRQILVAEDERRLERYGQPLSLNLYEPIFAKQFNSLERNFAFFLEEQKIIEWWHRVSVRQPNEYFLKGWRPERIWPDFVAMASFANGRKSILVLDTKGSFLQGNDDTRYKKNLFDVLQKKFNASALTVEQGPIQGVFRLIFDNEEFSTILPSKSVKA